MFEVWEGKCGWVIFEINENMSLDFVLTLGASSVWHVSLHSCSREMLLQRVIELKVGETFLHWGPHVPAPRKHLLIEKDSVPTKLTRV